LFLALHIEEPLLPLVGSVLALVVFFRGPKRIVTFDVFGRELWVKQNGLFTGPFEKVFKFDDVNLLVSESMAIGIRTTEGPMYLMTLVDLWANRESLKDLISAFTPEGVDSSR